MKTRIATICTVLVVFVAGLLANAAESLPAYVSSPDFLPGCAELLQEHQPLFRGGCRLLPNEADGSWLVLGAGTAPLVLEGGKKQSERDAWRVANNNALAALIEALCGVRMSANESAVTQSRQSVAGSRATEQFQSMSVTERNGIIAGSWEVGRWKLGRGNEVAVLRVVASPGHPIAKLAGRIPVLSDTLDPDWREGVLTRPTLRYGGVAAMQHKGKTWLLVAGITQIEKNVVAVPYDAEIIVEEEANVEWLRFLQGTQIQDRTEVKLEMKRIQVGDEPAMESIRETISSRMKAQEFGQPRMTPVGMWLSDDGNTYRLAAVFRLSLSDGKPDAVSGSLLPPTIPR